MAQILGTKTKEKENNQEIIDNINKRFQELKNNVEKNITYKTAGKAVLNILKDAQKLEELGISTANFDTQGGVDINGKNTSGLQSIAELQTFLVSQSFPLATDGYFGKETEKFLMQYLKIKKWETKDSISYLIDALQKSTSKQEGERDFRIPTNPFLDEIQGKPPQQQKNTVSDEYFNKKRERIYKEYFNTALLRTDGEKYDFEGGDLSAHNKITERLAEEIVKAEKKHFRLIGKKLAEDILHEIHQKFRTAEKNNRDTYGVGFEDEYIPNSIIEDFLRNLPSKIETKFTESTEL